MRALTTYMGRMDLPPLSRSQVLANLASFWAALFVCMGLSAFGSRGMPTWDLLWAMVPLLVRPVTYAIAWPIFYSVEYRRLRSRSS